MIPGTHIKLLVADLDFLEKIGPKIGFFEFMEEFGHSLLLNLFYNENLYYLLRSYTSPIFPLGKIWVKVPSANKIGGFLNQLYLQSESMKYFDFLHVDKNSPNLKVNCKLFGWAWSKWVWPVQS